VRHVRMLGLCVVAALAIGAYAVSSASALPEWGKCEAKAGGKYSDSNCTVKAKKGSGAYEWHKGKTLKNVPFTGGNVGSGGVLTTLLRECRVGEPTHYDRTTRKKCAEEGGEEYYTGPVTIECESERNTGEASGANLIKNVAVVFRGCAAFGVIPCSNSTNEGEIQVNALKGKLGYIDKATKEVGVQLEPAKKHGEFAKFVCGGTLRTVVGVGNSKEGAYYEPESKGGNDGIISPITPVNQMTTKYKQVFTVNTELQQNIPNKLEKGKLAVLEDYIDYPEEPGQSADWSASGEEITNENTASEEGEIKA
jgi:hypothetical protein